MTSFVICIAGFCYLRNDGWHTGALQTDHYIKRRQQSGINITHCDAISALCSSSYLVWPGTTSWCDSWRRQIKISKCRFFHFRLHILGNLFEFFCITLISQLLSSLGKWWIPKMVCQILVWDCFVQVVLWCAMYLFSWNVGGKRVTNTNSITKACSITYIYVNLNGVI